MIGLIVAGALITLIAIVDIADINDVAGGFGDLVDVSVGLGLWLVLIGGIARRIVSDLGPEVPWHVTAYWPAYRYTAPPTPAETLDRA